MRGALNVQDRTFPSSQSLTVNCKTWSSVHYWWEHYNVYCIAPSACVCGACLCLTAGAARKANTFDLNSSRFWCTCLCSLFENECDKRFYFLVSSILLTWSFRVFLEHWLFAYASEFLTYLGICKAGLECVSIILWIYKIEQVVFYGGGSVCLWD